MKITDSKELVKVNQILSIMQEHFGNSMNPIRIKLMAFMLHTLCVMQTVGLHKQTSAISTLVKCDSNLLHIQRFIANYALSLNLATRMIFSLLPVKDGLVLSMDRTNWKFGEFNHLQGRYISITVQSFGQERQFHFFGKCKAIMKQFIQLLGHNRTVL